jgi:hypothetical protein
MLVMSSAVELVTQHYPIVLLTLCALAATVVALVRRRIRAGAADWPVTEGTIQTVSPAPNRYEQIADSHHVGDFSYTVNDDYYSGRVMISRAFSTHDHSANELVNQKIQVRYNPRKPERFSVPPQEVGDFLVDPWDVGFA